MARKRRPSVNQANQSQQLSRDDNAVLRSAQVGKLRLKGLEFAAIAEQTGYKDASGAWRAWKRYQKSLPAEETAEQRTEVRQRLNAAIAAIWDKIEDGDLWAIDRMVAIERLRMDLLGLAVPKEDERGGNMIVVREVPTGLLPLEALNGHSTN